MAGHALTPLPKGSAHPSGFSFKAHQDRDHLSSAPFVIGPCWTDRPPHPCCGALQAPHGRSLRLSAPRWWRGAADTLRGAPSRLGSPQSTLWFYRRGFFSCFLPPPQRKLPEGRDTCRLRALSPRPVPERSAPRRRRDAWRGVSATRGHVRRLGRAVCDARRRDVQRRDVRQRVSASRGHVRRLSSASGYARVVSLPDATYHSAGLVFGEPAGDVVSDTGSTVSSSRPGIGVSARSCVPRMPTPLAHALSSSWEAEANSRQPRERKSSPRGVRATGGLPRTRDPVSLLVAEVREVSDNRSRGRLKGDCPRPPERSPRFYLLFDPLPFLTRPPKAGASARRKGLVPCQRPLRGAPRVSPCAPTSGAECSTAWTPTLVPRG